MGNVTLKKRDPGSPVSRMYNENLVVTVRMPEIHRRREILQTYWLTSRSLQMVEQTRSQGPLKLGTRLVVEQ